MFGLRDDEGSAVANVSVTLPDLPDAIYQNVFSYLLKENHIRSVCLAACVCTGFRRAALASLALSTRMRPPVRNGKAALIALLPRMHGLTDLDLSNRYRDVDDDVLTAMVGMGNLTSLSLRSCEQVTMFGLAALGSGKLFNLRVLSLHSLGGIVNLAPLTTMTSLRDLDLSWCICLQPRMMPNLHRLHRLLLRGCEQVDDSLCTALCEGSEPELQELDVAYTRLSDDGLRTLAARCPALRKLAVAQNKDNLWSIGNCTEAGLCEFTRLRPDVQLVAIC
ncbi:hypothetical protein Vretimale_4084 [Volvox reticuliferus]|uniref:F-box domain-containing protein n=1 Tax=Volvox reticuliferus TaxID=1737510 RepID=A0A8J4DB88_9CHLO|nr:hypothetical protein Vretimale_4084 [Volvox reticuliferus]